MKRTVHWIILNALLLTALLCATVFASRHPSLASGCQNIYVAMAIFEFIMTLFVLLVMAVFKRSVKPASTPDANLQQLLTVLRKRPAPAWIIHTVNVASLALLIWHGWWFTTLIFANSLLFLTCSRECAKEPVIVKP